MKKRIAVIFDEDIYCQRGMFNAIRNRVKYLNDIADFDIDVFVIGCYEPWYIRRLRGTEAKKKVKSIVLDGITYHTLWYNFTLTDYILDVKLHLSPIFTKLFYKRLVNRIHGYDLISAHSTNCGLLAMRVSRRDKIPFCVTWHGNDIHTTPFKNKAYYNIVENILRTANGNFFVSENLQSIGKSIAPDMTSSVLYNGRNESFVTYSEERKKMLAEKFGKLQGDKVVAFVGNLMEVKNPQLIAPIFEKVKNKIDSPLNFWVIGSGKMQQQVEEDCKHRNLQCKFWGGQPSDVMPDFMNCIDVLILPSRNEGLPLVVVEAIACGANVVGSDVGGISEAIGKENVFPHGNEFVDKVSDRIVYMLTHKVEQSLLGVFEWKNTANKEFHFYKELLNEQK